MNTAKPNPKPSAAPAPAPASAKNPATHDQLGLGPEHAELAKFVGTWDVAFTFWAKEGAPPVSSAGRSIFTPIFNGRYIREDYTGEFMGKPFAGVGTLGFDRVAGHYVSVWFDNAGTGIMHSTAVPGLAGDDLTFEGVGINQETQEEQAVRHVLSWESDARFTLSFFKAVGDGDDEDEDEVQTMELVYSRRG
jgi:hypothetical protein